MKRSPTAALEAGGGPDTPSPAGPGDLLDALGNRPPVLRLKSNGLEDQEVERALRKLYPFVRLVVRREPERHITSPSLFATARKNRCGWPSPVEGEKGATAAELESALKRAITATLEGKP